MVVVASVVCEAKQVDLQISESPDLCSDIGSGSRKAFLEQRDMLDGSDLSSFVNAGLAGTSQAFGDTSDPSVFVSMVDSGPGPPEFWDRLKLPDFASEIDQGNHFGGPAVYRHGRSSLRPLRQDPGSYCRSPEIYRMGRVLLMIATGSGKPFPKYGRAVWMQDSLDTRKEAPDVLLRELEVGLHVLTCTKGLGRDTGVPWPESACRSDLLNFAGTFDPGLGQPYPRPDDIVGFPDSLDIGFGRPSLGSDDVLVSLIVFDDVNPGYREIGPGYSLFRRLLERDVLKLLVGPMNPGVVTIMRDKGLGDPTSLHLPEIKAE